MATIALDHRPTAGEAGAWMGDAAARLAARLRELGHGLASPDQAAAPDAYLALALDDLEGPELSVAPLVDDDADQPSLDLAAQILAVLPESPLDDDTTPDPLLDPQRGWGARARCLCRIAPGREHGWAERQRLAEALAGALDRHLRAAPARFGRRQSGGRQVDIYHEVPLVPQVTGMSCWAACAAMIVGWRDAVYVEPREIAQGLGRWQAYQDGLQPTDVDSLARVWGLTIEPTQRYCPLDLERLLTRHGPLWVGQADPDLHVITVIGLVGDGTPEGTVVRINDPWPPGVGERYSLPLAELQRNFHTASQLVGLHAQILHVAGRTAGGAGTVRVEREWDIR